MKKILILALAVIMTGTMSACGMGDVGGSNPSSAPAQSKAQSASSAIGSKDVEDNFAGLLKYLSANSAIYGNASKMKPEFIGAKSGLKYQFDYNGKGNVTVELYEFDINNLDGKAKSVLNDIKEKGSFTILNNNFPAVVSDNGKYMMIYRDTSSSKDENKKHQEEVTELFKDFKK